MSNFPNKKTCDRCGRPLGISIYNLDTHTLLCIECHHKDRHFTKPQPADDRGDLRQMIARFRAMLAAKLKVS